MKYIPVIGLEIHAELSTASKVFCTCSAQFGGEHNTRCCPRCSGLPGTLPVLNKRAVEYAVKAGLALQCHINGTNAFDRKNYFYPDLPKAYQISQFAKPICTEGHVDIGSKEVRINRIHIEEDAGKLIHDDFEGISLADYNRCGVPLIEIVTEPDLSSAEEAKRFVEEIILRLKYAGVCDCKMEQGSLRADVNISVMPEGATKFGTRTEIKNLNSLRSILRAAEYEIERQIDVLTDGGVIIQETRRFDDASGTTSSLRSKEESHDYRYFPEPDIPPVLLTDEEIEGIAHTMPEMPAARLARYIGQWGLPAEDAKLIIADKDLSDFYNRAVAVHSNYRGTANLVVGELLRLFNDSGASGADLNFSPENLAALVKLGDDGKISKNAVKDILRILFTNGGDPGRIAEENGFLMQSDTGATTAVISEVLAANEKAVKEFREGSDKVFGFLMGQVSRKIGRGANPQLIREELMKALKQP